MSDNFIKWCLKHKLKASSDLYNGYLELQVKNEKLKKEIKYKDLDIEMYQGHIVEVRQLANNKLPSWQEEDQA